MARLASYIDGLLAHGRSYFSRDEALAALGVGPAALGASITRAIRSRQVANPRHGFYLILRPEDRVAGAPDPVRWLDPLMKHQGVGYRISLLRAAAFHGSSHFASMVLQVVAPRQMRDIELGRHRLQFLYQSPDAFAQTNRPDWLQHIKSDAGFAIVSGVELTLLDSARYLGRAGGIDTVARIVADLGAKARSRVLKQAAGHYECTTVRRLGYMLEHAGHERQASALDVFARSAKSVVPLNPSLKPVVSDTARAPALCARWGLMLNDTIETAP